MRATVTADDASLSGLEERFVRHAPSALRLAYFLTGDREAARDIVQDAFVRMAGRFRHLRQPEAFDVYLRRTIVNLHASRLREASGRNDRRPRPRSCPHGPGGARGRPRGAGRDVARDPEPPPASAGSHRPAVLRGT